LSDREIACHLHVNSLSKGLVANSYCSYAETNSLRKRLACKSKDYRNDFANTPVVVSDSYSVSLSRSYKLTVIKAHGTETLRGNIAITVGLLHSVYSEDGLHSATDIRIGGYTEYNYNTD